MPQVFALEIPREVVHDDLPDEALGAAVVAEAASRNVGREQHILHAPERRGGRERLGIAHIEHRAAQMTVRKDGAAQEDRLIQLDRTETGWTVVNEGY